MKHKLDTNNNQRGFTLIEVVAVLMIIGIVAVIAMVRVSSTEDIDLASQVEAVKGHLRFAQIRAMNTDSNWGIHFSETSYYLFQGTDSSKVMIIGEDSPDVDLAAKKSKLRITPPAGNNVTFDQYGSPGDANVDIATNCSACANGGVIRVTKNTGFIK
jgi:MSHA pilin protein MshC